METLLTIKDKKVLIYLSEALEFGSDIFTDYLFNKGTKNYKKQFIAFHFGVIHNYSEAIHALCKDARPHASMSLLRSVFEAFVNMIYFVNTNSNLKIAKYTIADLEVRKKAIKQFKNFIKKYPECEGKYAMTTEQNLDELIVFHDLNIEAVKNGNRFYKSTKIKETLRDRAEAYDKKVKNNGAWEYNYILIYKYFSSYTHLSLAGMENFTHGTSDNMTFDIGRAKIKDPVLETTFGFYVTMLNYVRNRGYIPKKIKLTKFDKQLKEMQKDIKVE